MFKKTFLACICLSVAMLGFGQKKNKKSAAPVRVTIVAIDSSKLKKPALSIKDKVKSSKKIEGLFTAYQDTAVGSMQLFIKKDQLGKEYIYQSFSINGPTALYLNQSMHRSTFVFKVMKSFDKLEFVRVNNSFYYDSLNAISKTKDVDKPEAVFTIEKIVAEDSSGYLVNADALFISERLDPIKPASPPSFFSMPSFNLGGLNPTKSKYYAVRSFPNNTDFVVDLAYDNPGAYISGGADVTDPRYVRIRMQHSLIEMPDNDFTSRLDDPRVGYFTQRVTDQTSISPVPYKDKITRWNLVKKDPNTTLSEPLEPIVFWVENTTPLEYRQIIVDAGLKWNAAFEKAGFKNAVQMKIMPDSVDWDPADIRYNVIRWVASANPTYGAIGPSFINPKTGQILGADISIEWYSGSATPNIAELFDNKVAVSNTTTNGDQEYRNCTLASELKAQLTIGITALDAAGTDAKQLGEMHQQFLTYLILHEMGHTLGLNHNMKASQMWSPAEINNKELTRKYGLIGSVMDYPAVNVALDKKKQGDYYTTVAGPYDLWAIEYGYTPLSDKEEKAALTKILSRSTDPKLAFGNDGDDMRSPGKAMDPRINVDDLTSDAIGYAVDRFKLVNKIMGTLVAKYSKPGQSYAELRSRFNSLQNQRLSMISAVSRYVGGVYMDRSFPEQQSKTKPFTPVSKATQKRAISVLNKYVFAPNAFDADAPVFPYLQPQRRGFSQAMSGDDYKITSVVLMQQMSGALSHILHPATMLRITNSRLYGNQYSLAEILSDLTTGIFAADLKTNVNVYRQYLQSNYVKGLLSIVDSKSGMYDDMAKAAALYAVRKIKTQMTTATSDNEETKAHRASIIYLINTALEPK